MFPVVAGALVLLFFAYCWSASQVKALDFDEVFTFNVAHQSTRPAFLYSMVADGNPPLGALLCRLSTSLFGDSAFVLRLPSILTTSAAVLLFACFLKKRAAAPLALASMAMLMADPVVRGYAIEARPYGLMLFFTALAMLSWQRCDPDSAGLWPYVGVTVAIAGALLSHYFALISVGLPLLAGEALRSIRRRSFDKKLVLAALVGLQAAWLTVPTIMATQRLLGPKALLSPLGRTRALFWAYRQLVSPSYFVTLLLGIAICVTFVFVHRHRPVRRPAWPPEEVLAMVTVLLALIAVGFAVPVSVTFGFRYAIGGVLGLVGLLVYLLRWATPAGALALTVCMAVNFVPRPNLAGKTGAGVLEARLSVPEVHKELACLSTVAPSLEMAVESGSLYATLFHYAEPALQARLHYLTDLSYLPGQPEDIPQVALAAQAPVFPQALRSYSRFVQQHQHFLLVDHGNGSLDRSNLEQRLAHDGFRKTPYPMNGCASQHLSLWMVSPG